MFHFDWLNVAIWSLIALAIVAVGLSINASYEKSVYLETNGCSLTSEAPTGKKIWCGKACYRNEIRKEYSCRAFPEPLVIIQ